MEDKLRELMFQINVVCYEKEMIEKMSGVWKAFFELQSEFKKLNLHVVSGSAFNKEQQDTCEHEFYETWFVNEDKTPFELHGYECIKCGKVESMI